MCQVLGSEAYQQANLEGATTVRDRRLSHPVPEKGSLANYSCVVKLGPVSLPYPPLENLNSSSERESAASWSAAYPLLWEAGLRVALIRLAGQTRVSDREDVVSTALAQVVRGYIEKTSESYNQIRTFDDLLGMMRHIVRCRIADLHRSRGRRPEDPVEEIPEAADLTPDLRRFQLHEIIAEVDKLNPPLPQVFRDRFIEGWSTDEIAERRGINRNTLLSQFRQGFAILRVQLTKLEVLP